VLYDAVQESSLRARLDLPQPIVPLFWGLLFLEATYGAYMGVWPLWIERLGAPIAIVGLILGAGGVLRLFVLGPSAAIADRFGYRRTIIAARVVAVAGFLGAALATHWSQLILIVLMLAIGEMVFPLIQTLVAAGAGDQRMRSFALVFNVGPSIALAISPLIGAGLVAAFGMRSAFVLGALFSVLSLVSFSRLREIALPQPAEDAPKASYRAAWQEPGVRLVGGLLLVTVFSLSFGVSFIPTFLEDVRGFAASEIAALSALPALGSAAFGLGVARIGALQRMPFIAAAIPVGSMALAFLIFRQSSLLPLLVLAFLLRGGLFSAWATMISALGELAPERLRSRSFALLEMIGGLAFALGPMIAGLAYARRATLPFDVAIVLAVALVPLFLWGQRRANRMTQGARHEATMGREAVAVQAVPPAPAESSTPGALPSSDQPAREPAA
jgi:MFS family permease